MARWKPAPVIGGAYSDDAKAWSDQDTVNWIPVVAERGGTRTPTMLRDAPGLVVISDLGTNAPIRGTHNVEGLLLAVSGNKLFKIGVDGAGTEIGTIPGVERVSMAHNQITGGNEVAIANGQSGYVYNTVTETLTQITDDGFPGAISFDFCDGYIMGIEPGRRFGFHSQLAAAGDYNTLDRYEAEGSPDKLVGQIVTHREWWLFGERTIEPYTNTGAATGTFQRASGTVIEVGAASRYAICQMDNSVFWLGGDGVVYRANGYTPVRISTHAIEQAIARCNTAQAFAFTLEDRGHKIFSLPFPDGQTWGYDAASGEWHRRQSYGLDRWRINTLTKWRGAWIAGDYSNGRIYQLDWNTSNEAGDILERRRITGVLSDSQNPVTVNGVALVFDTGNKTETNNPLIKPLAISGNLQDGYVGEGVSYQYALIGGVRPLNSVVVSSGSLPAGLSISASGLVTGVRTTSGSYAWTLGTTDAYGTPATLDDISSSLIPRVASFNGTSQYLSTPYAAPIISTGDFTVQARISFNAAGPYGVVSGRNSNIRGWAVQINSDGSIVVRMSMNTGLIDTTTNIVSAAGVIPTHVMTHVAFTRYGDVFTIWVNGVSVATKTMTGSIDEPSVANLALGTTYLATGENRLSGHMDWFALTVGKCLYTTTFTPPNSAADVGNVNAALDFNESVGSTTFADLTGRTWVNTGGVAIVEYPY